MGNVSFWAQAVQRENVDGRAVGEAAGQRREALRGGAAGSLHHWPAPSQTVLLGARSKCKCVEWALFGISVISVLRSCILLALKQFTLSLHTGNAVCTQ